LTDASFELTDVSLMFLQGVEGPLEPRHPAIEQRPFAVQFLADLLNALRIRGRRGERTGPHDAAAGCGHGDLRVTVENG